jgi:hypothetical protein
MLPTQPRLTVIKNSLMKIHHLFTSFPLLLLSACAPIPTAPPPTLINPAHLAHLYEEIAIGDTLLGAIWIYCEAPDYRLVPDEDEGFTCVDDVARALVFYCRHYRAAPSPELLGKIQRLTDFLLYMQADNGYFYNFLLPGNTINTEHINSRAVPAFWSWRAWWALSEVNLLEAEGLEGWQAHSRQAIAALMANLEALCPDPGAISTFDGIVVPRCLAELGADQTAVIMMSLANDYRTQPSASVKEQLLFWGELLLHAQQGDAEMPPHYAFLSWQNHWHAWGNSQAYALLYAGRILEHQPFIEAGLREVRHFYPYYLEQGFIHSFRLEREGDELQLRDYRQYPQIAYDLRPMVFAALEAFTITNDPKYADIAGRLAAWLFGHNPAGQRMYDPATGRTFDGISAPEEVNRNSGAESTIEALLVLQAIEAVPAAQAALRQWQERGDAQ